MCGPRIAIAIVCFTEPNTLCTIKPPFVFFSEVEVAAARTSGLVNLVLSRQTGFFECEQRFNGEQMVINDHAVASTRLLGSNGFATIS